MRRSVIVVVLLAAALFACAAPRIDGRNEETARATIRRARHWLPAEKQKAFDDALRTLMTSVAPLPSLHDAEVRAVLNGKTGDEVIAAAEALQKEAAEKAHEAQLEREKAQIDSAFATIEQRDRAELARAARPMPAAPPMRVQSNLSPAVVAALASTDTALVINAADSDVRLRCVNIAGADGDKAAQCVRAEMNGKAQVNGALPNGVPAGIGQRIRDHCTTKSPDSFADRATCENDTVAAIQLVLANPALLNSMPQERQTEIRALLKR